jgi:hypothetical protein
MSLSDAMKKLKFDVRLTDHQIKYGELDQKDLEKHLGTLDDVSNNADTINIFDIDTDEKHNQQSH